MRLAITAERNLQTLLFVSDAAGSRPSSGTSGMYPFSKVWVKQYHRGGSGDWVKLERGGGTGGVLSRSMKLTGST